MLGLSLACNPVNQLADIPENRDENRRLARLQFNTTLDQRIVHEQIRHSQLNPLCSMLSAEAAQAVVYWTDQRERYYDKQRIEEAPDLWKRLEAARVRHGLTPD